MLFLQHFSGSKINNPRGSVDVGNLTKWLRLFPEKTASAACLPLLVFFRDLQIILKHFHKNHFFFRCAPLSGCGDRLLPPAGEESKELVEVDFAGFVRVDLGLKANGH